MPATDQRLNRRVTPKTAPPSEVLRYSIAPCPLGYLLLAASAKGICAVLIGDTPDAVQTELQQRFAEAALQVDDAGLSDDVQQVVGQLNDAQHPAQLTLDMRGSAFQQQVWQALLHIPCGQTRTYSELAAPLGSHPRAVASACARNPLGLLVPCHRVIARNGALSGYRWGLQRKAALLKQEADTQTL
jgi:AraC family transcriptional regulator, regulatory protein of adaptative response / methylated-DNA-[protein]-cysteine methyltransferase